jgi:hypothetical protein
MPAVLAFYKNVGQQVALRWIGDEDGSEAFT